MSARRVAAAVALALASWAPSLLAQDAGVSGVTVAASSDEARRLFEQAVTVLNEQRFGEAVSLLERSVSLREHPAALAALAASYRGVGRYRSAMTAIDRLLAINTDAAREQEARAVRAECERALAHVTLQVRGEPSEVLVDGERVATTDVTQELTLDPGPHRVEVRRVGYEPVVEERRLEVGGRTVVALDASARPLPATLVVETPEATTTIRVDGRPVGHGRHSMPLPLGRHAILVNWEDGYSQERFVELSPGARMVVSITPNRPPSITSRWWFWAGAVAITAGVVAGVVALSSSQEDPVMGNWAHVPNAITFR